MPMQYGVIAGKLGKMPSYYDVWIEDAAGTRLTYIQRYYASDIRSEEEQYVQVNTSSTTVGWVELLQTGEQSKNVSLV